MAGQADRVAPAGMVLVTGEELAEAVASVRGTVVAVLGPSGNGDVVEDVLQSTWESAWHSRERFDPDRGSLRTWVGTIARNRAVDHLRAVGRSRAGQEALEASAVAREKTAVSTIRRTRKVPNARPVTFWMVGIHGPSKRGAMSGTPAATVVAA